MENSKNEEAPAPKKKELKTISFTIGQFNKMKKLQKGQKRVKKKIKIKA